MKLKKIGSCAIALTMIGTTFSVSAAEFNSENSYDMAALQGWLLQGESSSIAYELYDLDRDGAITGIDLTILRQEMLRVDDTNEDTEESLEPSTQSGDVEGDDSSSNTPGSGGPSGNIPGSGNSGDEGSGDSSDTDDDTSSNTPGSGSGPSGNVPGGNSGDGDSGDSSDTDDDTSSNTPGSGGGGPSGNIPGSGNSGDGDSGDSSDTDENTEESLEPSTQSGDVENDNIIYVTNETELYAAMNQASAGNIIVVAAGTYSCSTEVSSSASGTESEPIILRAEDTDNPPVFVGSSLSQSCILHICGEYWDVENIKFETAQKAVVYDHADHSILRGCEVYNTGSEAVDIRDGSSYCLVQNCYIHDTGLVSPGYGEGVYIGSSSSTTGYDYYCDYNTVDGCTFYNVAAEHVDVKEYTTGTEIMNCTFYGDGMSGENYAGSFIDIAGSDCYVHDNVGYRDGNEKIVAAFEMHDEVAGWAKDAVFSNNTLYMDQPYGAEDTTRRMYVVDAWGLTFSVHNNLVDYGSGLISIEEGDAWMYYNTDTDCVTFF